MKRICTAVTVGAVASLALAAPAIAAPKTVTHVRTNGMGATAWWPANDGGDVNWGVDAAIEVSRTKSDSHLTVGMTRYTIGDGGIVGSISTYADVTTGFTFSIDSKKFRTAHVAGTNLPGQICTWLAADDSMTCKAGKVTVTADWTGTGPLNRMSSTEQFRSDGFRQKSIWRGLNRDATATATINGVTFSAGALEDASLGTFKMMQTTKCPVGSECPTD